MEFHAIIDILQSIIEYIQFTNVLLRQLIPNILIVRITHWYRLHCPSVSTVHAVKQHITSDETDVCVYTTHGEDIDKWHYCWFLHSMVWACLFVGNQSLKSTLEIDIYYCKSTLEIDIYYWKSTLEIDIYYCISTLEIYIYYWKSTLEIDV